MTRLWLQNGMIDKQVQALILSKDEYVRKTLEYGTGKKNQETNL